MSSNSSLSSMDCTEDKSHFERDKSHSEATSQEIVEQMEHLRTHPGDIDWDKTLSAIEQHAKPTSSTECETECGGKLNMDVVKKCCGGDSVKASDLIERWGWDETTKTYQPYVSGMVFTKQANGCMYNECEGTWACSCQTTLTPEEYAKTHVKAESSEESSSDGEVETAYSSGDDEEFGVNHTMSAAEQARYDRSCAKAEAKIASERKLTPEQRAKNSGRPYKPNPANTRTASIFGRTGGPSWGPAFSTSGAFPGIIRHNDLLVNAFRKPTHYDEVKSFTKESWGELPKTPRSMTLEEAKFLFKMKFSEAAEFFTSFHLTKGEISTVLHDCVEGGLKDLQPWKDCTDEVERIVRQTDSIIDDEYYTYNGAAKCALPVDECFTEVQRANMDKRFPDGTFHKREDGKIIKPPTWKERDLTSIVKNLTKEDESGLRRGW